jgi:hypothetical protein
MITKFKLFENINELPNNNFLLCIKEPDPNYFWKFTKGKKYKIYFSSLGLRIKDDKGNFDRLIGLDDDDYWKRKIENDVVIWNYADGIFTTDNSIEDYEIREKTKKYNL